MKAPMSYTQNNHQKASIGTRLVCCTHTCTQNRGTSYSARTRLKGRKKLQQQQQQQRRRGKEQDVAYISPALICPFSASRRLCRCISRDSHQKESRKRLLRGTRLFSLEPFPWGLVNAGSRVHSCEVIIGTAGINACCWFL